MKRHSIPIKYAISVTRWHEFTLSLETAAHEVTFELVCFYPSKANTLKHLYVIDSTDLDIRNWVKFRLKLMSSHERDFQQLCVLLNPLSLRHE